MKILFLAFAVLFTLIVPHPGVADGTDTKFSGFVKYSKYHVDYEVRGDGTHTERYDIVLAVLTDEGAAYANQANISYSASLETVEIISAFTVKNDGTQVPVPSRNIQEREAIAGGGPMFSDIKTTVIIFPDVAAGDKVAYSYRHIQKTPLFPGHFSVRLAFDRLSAYDDVRVTLSSPADSIKLNVSAAGVDGGFAGVRDGRNSWAWTFSNDELLLPESGSVDPLDYGPRIVVSSFRDYGEVAASYEARAARKSVPTDRIRALAAELTKGIHGKKEQARALYNWVSTNINYAGNCIGTGSVVPHDAETVLANRLGDCKDHAALLQALLAAKGIESTPALVNFGGAYKLPEVATPFVFNHVINYIPGMDLYMDATAKLTPFAQLPTPVSDKPVIHTARYAGIRRTPATDYRSTNSHMSMTINIRDDGSADGLIKNRASGPFSDGVRSGIAAIPPNVKDVVVRTALSRSGLTGGGAFFHDDPRALNDEYSFGMEYTVDNAVNLPGPAAIHISSPLPSGGPIASYLSGLNLLDRTLEYTCFGGTSTEEFTINIPKSMRVISMPRDTSKAVGDTTYSATYARSGDTIRVVRRLEDRTATNLCPPKKSADLKPLKEAILKDLKSQIIYE